MTGHPSKTRFDISLEKEPCPDSSLVIRFSPQCHCSAAHNEIHTGLPLLANANTVECWHGPVAGRWHSDLQGTLKVLQSDDFLLVSVWLDTHNCSEFSEATEQAYSTMLGKAEQSGFGKPVRTWNYIPNINEGEGDREIYKQFCAGRARAYEKQGIADADFAAASALGTTAGQAVFYQLSTRAGGKHFENPQQLSAYQYPRQYGPRSPSFARATQCTVANREVLFISGTASVSGHLSLHENDVKAQTRQTLDNIATLLASTVSAGQAVPTPAFLKAYIRHPADLAIVQGLVAQTYPNCPCVYLQADICRRELLVEIDGHCWI